MKKLLFLLLFPLMAFGQTNELSFYVTQDTATILGRAYANAKIDTCAAINLLGWDEYYLMLYADDSAEVYVKYKLGVNDTDWSALKTADSLITTVADGKIFNLTTLLNGAAQVKFYMAFEAAGNGVTSANYTARFTMRR